MTTASTNVSAGDLLACRTCGQVHEALPLQAGTIALCSRCGSRMQRRTWGSLHLTAAFSLAALLFYIPANIFPILRLEKLGLASDNTIWSGCVALYRDNDWFIAIIVFLASILIPLVKLTGLFFLVVTTVFHSRRARNLRTWVYKNIEAVGRWAMLDVFVLAILVSLVKLQRLATILPGKGLFAFCAVVVFTLLASASFDPQLIWNDEEE